MDVIIKNYIAFDRQYGDIKLTLPLPEAENLFQQLKEFFDNQPNKDNPNG
jgi:hypothetical protein